MIWIIEIFLCGCVSSSKSSSLIKISLLVENDLSYSIYRLETFFVKETLSWSFFLSHNDSDRWNSSISLDLSVRNRSYWEKERSVPIHFSESFHSSKLIPSTTFLSCEFFQSMSIIILSKYLPIVRMLLFQSDLTRVLSKWINPWRTLSTNWNRRLISWWPMNRINDELITLLVERDDRRQIATNIGKGRV